jgi:hypothetical protein
MQRTDRHGPRPATSLIVDKWPRAPAQPTMIQIPKDMPCPLPGHPAQRTTRHPASPGGHGVAAKRGRGDQQATHQSPSRHANPGRPAARRCSRWRRGRWQPTSPAHATRPRHEGEGFIVFPCPAPAPDRPTEPVPFRSNRTQVRIVACLLTGLSSLATMQAGDARRAYARGRRPA